VSKPRTVLGFDYGARRIGVAVGQELTGTARALHTIHAHNSEPDWDAIAGLIKDWQPDLLVVGMPHNMDDTPHPLAETVRRFGLALQARYNLPVEWIDEKLSSVEAEQQLAERQYAKSRRRDKTEIDKLAAQVILQTWLNNNIR